MIPSCWAEKTRWNENIMSYTLNFLSLISGKVVACQGDLNYFDLLTFWPQCLCSAETATLIVKKIMNIYINLIGYTCKNNIISVLNKPLVYVYSLAHPQSPPP